MVKKENYNKAYKEVYEILKYIPNRDKEKIPKEFLDMLEEKMDKNHSFSIDKKQSSIEYLDIMYETKTVLAYIFMKYLATNEQRKTVNVKMRKEIEIEENKKREKYGIDVFKNRRAKK